MRDWTPTPEPPPELPLRAVVIGFAVLAVIVVITALVLIHLPQ